MVRRQDSMKQVKIIIGGNFGDEGKGLMTAYFADKMTSYGSSCITVLSNGGAQRGHTVVRNGLRHVFRHLGSGTFAGADTWCPDRFILNPMIFMQEYRELTEQLGHPPAVRIYVHPDCLVTTPYEMLANQIIEESRGDARHGSVGVGIWETLIGGGITFGEITSMDNAGRLAYLTGNRKERLYKRIRDFGIGRIPEDWLTIVEDPGLALCYLEDLAGMEQLISCADASILKEYPNIIFENGQGLLLDRLMKNHGYGHHTTPSYTGARNPAEILKESGLITGEDIDVEAVYVTRSYMTRHGTGRFDTECPVEEIGPGIKDLTNMPNPSQGSLRYGRLSMKSLERRALRDHRAFEAAAGIQAGFSIAMTHLNEYETSASRSRYIRYRSYAEDGPEMIYAL